MKQTKPFLLAIVMLALNACSNARSEAEKQTGEVQKATKEDMPGSIATSASGYYMKAKINGKDWAASYMKPDDDVSSSYKMIHGADNGDYITFSLWKRGVQVGKKLPFSDDDVANLSLEQLSGLYSGKSGDVVITKLDDRWMEGTFKFAATSGSSDKKVEVTDGSFRVALVPGLK